MADEEVVASDAEGGNKKFKITVVFKNGYVFTEVYKKFEVTRDREGRVTKLAWELADDSPGSQRIFLMDINEIVLVTSEEILPPKLHEKPYVGQS